MIKPPPPAGTKPLTREAAEDKAAELARVRTQVLSSGSASESREPDRYQADPTATPFPLTTDPAAARLFAHLANALVAAPAPGSVRTVDRAATALDELAKAQKAAVGDQLHLGVAALGRIERAVGELGRLGRFPGLDPAKLVPREYLDQLRERWYPKVAAELEQNLYATVDTGIDLRRMAALVELGSRGDAAIRGAVAENLEPMLLKAAFDPAFRDQQLQVLELLAQFPPRTAPKQAKLVTELEAASRKWLGSVTTEGLASAVAAMTPADGAIVGSLASLAGSKSPPALRVAALQALARTNKSDWTATRAVRDAIHDPSPEVAVAALDAAAKLRMESEWKTVEALVGRNTDLKSKNPVDPAVKAAALRALAATAPSDPKDYTTRDWVNYYCEAVFNGFASSASPDAHPLVRQAAVQALAELSPTTDRLSSSAVYYLLDIAKKHPEHREVAFAGVRRHAPIGGTGSRIDEALKGLAEGDWGPIEETTWMRAALLSVLRANEAPGGGVGPIACLADADPGVRLLAREIVIGLAEKGYLYDSSFEQLTTQLTKATLAEGDLQLDAARTMRGLLDAYGDKEKGTLGTLAKSLERKMGKAAKEILKGRVE